LIYALKIYGFFVLFQDTNEKDTALARFVASSKIQNRKRKLSLLIRFMFFFLIYLTFIVHSGRL